MVKVQVCDFSRNYIRVQCPECTEQDDKEAIIDFDAGEGTCPLCDISFGMDLLLTEFDVKSVASCPECSHTTGSVIEYGEGYLCLSCGSDFDRTGECDWCSETVAGDLSGSYLDGCMFCDGLYGHTADD